MVINELVDFLKECDNAYYNTDTPIATNDTYDALVETLRKMDPTNEYLNKIGAKVSSNKVGRTVKMGTLNKFHTEESVRQWYGEHHMQILVGPKYDGFGVELLYTDGNLVLGSTRGDGLIGEDVTESMKLINNVPHKIAMKGDLRVRGEAIIPNHYKDKMKELGYSAMRNAVPGIVRSGREDALQYVDFVAYEFIEENREGRDTRSAQREYYKGTFEVEDYKVFDTFEDIVNWREDFALIRDTYIYETDGVVLKSNNLIEDDYGFPKYQIAWKFKSNREVTTLRDIEYQMGVTGKFTPIGIFDEVEFQGAKLTRASLGNMTRLNGFTIHPAEGSVIEVTRRGDIIPYIEDITYNPSDAKEFPQLTKCPHCGSELVGYPEVRCANKSCPERLRLQIIQYVKGLGVKGIGPSLVTKLIEMKHLTCLSDVYTMGLQIIPTIPGQGESAVKKWEELTNKELTPLTFLSALPSDNIGTAVWKKLLEIWTLDEILNLTAKDFEGKTISGVGQSKIDSILSFLDEMRDEVKYMKDFVFEKN